MGPEYLPLPQDPVDRNDLITDGIIAATYLVERSNPVLEYIPAIKPDDFVRRQLHFTLKH